MDETALARVTGKSCFIKPYISQLTVPVNMSEYMGNDKSPVDFVLTVFITCGKNAEVVKNAASSPMDSIRCIGLNYRMTEEGRQIPGEDKLLAVSY